MRKEESCILEECTAMMLPSEKRLQKRGSNSKYNQSGEIIF